MQENFSFFLSETCQSWHHFLEFFLVLDVLLISGSGLEIHGLDKNFEFVALGIHVLESMLADVFFIVEFGNFFLFIKIETLKFIPIVSSKFSEKIILLLTFLWRWIFNSLVHVKWEGQKLLSIGGSKLFVTIEFINGLLVDIKFIMKFLDEQVERTWWQWLLSVVGLVDKSLKGNWITIGLFELI